MSALLRLAGMQGRRSVPHFPPHHRLALTRCAKLLLRFGAKVDGRSEEEEETPLHAAARLGHVELADLLLRRGACPDARDAEGWTPLLAACDTRCTSPADAEATTARCLQLCRLLLSAGADADAADQDKRRPLHLACRRGHAAVVELLLSCGVSVNAMDYGGHTALHCALQGPPAALAQSPERAVRALLNHGAVRVWPGALPKVRGWGRREGTRVRRRETRRSSAPRVRPGPWAFHRSAQSVFYSTSQQSPPGGKGEDTDQWECVCVFACACTRVHVHTRVYM